MSMSAQLREAQDARSARAAARHIMPAVTTNRELPANFAAAASPETAAAAASPAPQQQEERGQPNHPRRVLRRLQEIDSLPNSPIAQPLLLAWVSPINLG